MKNFKLFLRHPQNIIIALFMYYGWWIPDAIYLHIIYILFTKKKLNLSHPVTFNEKLQWLKLHDRNPLYTKLVDKYDVKGIVADIIGEKYIIPTLAVWDTVEALSFTQLPDKFVLKTTHGGGGSGVYICDKKKLDEQQLRERMRKSLSRSIWHSMREWPYRDIRSRVIAEPYIQQSNSSETGLTDYKFFCFHGEPKFCQVKTHSESEDTIDIFDLQWNLLPFTCLNPNHKHAYPSPLKPLNYEEMINLARKISHNSLFERIDFYNVNGRIYFGEITFYPASGFGKFTPEEYDEFIGGLLYINCDEGK